MKRKLIAAGFAALFAASVWAQSGPMGPGMMGGYGYGYGYGYGMGPGMMGGYGPGYGMHSGWGLAALNLSDAQQAKISEIQREVSRKQWEIMGRVHEQQYRLQEQLDSGKADDVAARKAYAAMSDAHKQMFENQLDARKRIDAVLTPEQRAQLRSRVGPRWGGPGPGGAK